jgi:hypothetical protein
MCRCDASFYSILIPAGDSWHVPNFFTTHTPKRKNLSAAMLLFCPLRVQYYMRAFVFGCSFRIRNEAVKILPFSLVGLYARGKSLPSHQADETDSTGVLCNPKASARRQRFNRVNKKK